MHCKRQIQVSWNIAVYINAIQNESLENDLESELLYYGHTLDFQIRPELRDALSQGDTVARAVVQGLNTLNHKQGTDSLWIWSS